MEVKDALTIKVKTHPKVSAQVGSGSYSTQMGLASKLNVKPSVSRTRLI